MKISVVLTFYKQTFAEFIRWLNYFEELEKFKRDYLQILILSDNPNLMKPFYEEAELRGVKLIPSKNNLKKAKLIHENIINGNITGDYIKICDPDDYLIPSELINFFDVINKHTEPYINIHATSRYDYNLKTIDGNFYPHLRTFSRLPRPINFNSIYIASDIRDSNLDRTVGLGDDFYLFNTSLWKNRKILYHWNFSPYLWSVANGESNQAFSKDKANYKIFNTLDKFYEILEMVKALNDLDLPDKNKYPIDYWIVKCIQNNLIAYKKIRGPISIKAFFLMKSAMKEINKLNGIFLNGKKLDSIPKIVRFSLYFHTFINKKI